MKESTCPNCESKDLRPAIELTFLTQYKQRLSHCQECDFLFVPDPFWLPEAYQARFMGDTGLVRRNIRLEKALLPFLSFIHEYIPNFRGLDFGSGTGMFCRMMRDLGFEFVAYDEFAESELCKPFIIDTLEKEKFTVITAFEVLEHVPNPKELMQTLSGASENIIFTTCLRKNGDIPKSDWWYYAPEIAQHVGFHSPKSLDYLAESIGSQVTTKKSDLHLISPHKILHDKFSSLLGRGVISRIQKHFAVKNGKRKSLTWPDHFFVRKELEKDKLAETEKSLANDANT